MALLPKEHLPPSSHETAAPSTLRRGNLGRSGTRGRAGGGPSPFGAEPRHYSGLNPPGRFERISRLSLLKCRNSPYRPALRDRKPMRALRVPQTGLLGRSQAVRQRILIPPFGGSIPPAPAKLNP